MQAIPLLYKNRDSHRERERSGHTVSKNCASIHVLHRPPFVMMRRDPRSGRGLARLCRASRENIQLLTCTSHVFNHVYISRPRHVDPQLFGHFFIKSSEELWDSRVTASVLIEPVVWPGSQLPTQLYTARLPIPVLSLSILPSRLRSSTHSPPSPQTPAPLLPPSTRSRPRPSHSHRPHSLAPPPAPPLLLLRLGLSSSFAPPAT